MTSLFSLAGRVALITGGNGGLGLAMALGLQAAGARVAVTGRDPAKNRAAAGALGVEALVLSADVRDEAVVAGVVEAVVARYGRLDILVNNAGLARGGLVTEQTRADWDAVVETHLTGAFLCAKHAARSMLARGEGGKIINIGSMYSVFGGPGFVDYTSAKAGLLGLTRGLAVELGPSGIQVNAILPGWYPTDLTQTVLESPRAEQIRRRTPAGRWGRGDDLVGATVFLASAASDFITGVALPVDGGYSVSDRYLYE